MTNPDGSPKKKELPPIITRDPRGNVLGWNFAAFRESVHPEELEETPPPPRNPLYDIYKGIARGTTPQTSLLSEKEIAGIFNIGGLEVCITTTSLEVDEYSGEYRDLQHEQPPEIIALSGKTVDDLSEKYLLKQRIMANQEERNYITNGVILTADTREVSAQLNVPHLFMRDYKEDDGTIYRSILFTETPKAERAIYQLYKIPEDSDVEISVCNAAVLYRDNSKQGFREVRLM